VADRTAQRMTELIRPLLVTPGTKVTLPDDFDPGYKADFLHKKDGARLLRRLPAQAIQKGVWRRRYREINDWERYLSDNGFRVVKLFLNLSKEEQRTRFLKRLNRPDKTWKFSPSDIAERQYWDDYQRAYAKMLSNTSTPWAPWYVIPADHKWFARICVSAVIARTLVEIDPRYPQLSSAAQRELAAAKKALEAETPPPAASDPFQPGHGSPPHGD
jgi:Polyphosphate kinase 2 (PPK2)